MKLQLSLLSVGLALAVHAAGPQISNVTYAQDGHSRKVTVTYKLTGAAAVVTMDVQTNGVSIGEAIVNRALDGDVNRRVACGDDDRTITWYPERAWPGHRVDGNCRVVLKAWPLSSPPDILAVDLRDGRTFYYTSTNAVPEEGNVQARKYKTDYMVFRKIPAAGVRWRMGAPDGDSEKGTNEDCHWVTLTRDYYMAIYECTQAQLRKLKTDSSSFSVDRETRPAENVKHDTLRGGVGKTSWPTSRNVSSDSVVGILQARSGLAFDLPTEAQWEYACRAGTSTPRYSDAGIGLLARYLGNSSKGVVEDKDIINCDTTKGTAAVGMYLPNAWGLYDMLGNVTEKCRDRYAEHLGTSEVVDPKGDATAENWVAKGGCWRDPASFCRASYRGYYSWTDSYMSRGFRLCLELGE